MKRFLTILAALAALAGCQTSAQIASTMEAGTPVALNGRQLDAVRSGVRAVLKDPGSAQFGTIRAVRMSEGAYVVCGYVNARNSFGGYTGHQLFSGVMLDIHPKVAPDFTPMDTFGSTEAKRAGVLAVCRARGVQIS